MNNVSLFSVESLLTAAICAAALMLAARLCERRSAELAHTLWLLALVRLATPPIFEVAVPLLPAQATPALAPATSAPAPAVTASMVEAAPASFSIAQFIAAVWLLGALFFALLALIRSIRFERRLRRALPVEETLRARVRSSAAELGVRPPRIVLLDEAVSPMIWSALRRPRLVLPAPLLRDLSDDESEALIVHELAHLRRRDHWVRHLELLVMITQWWNPLAWWGRLRLRRVEEICCDRLVSHTLPQKRRAYAESLLKTMKYLAARRVRPRAAILQLALASGVGEIDRWKGRLTMILKPTEPRRLATPWRSPPTPAVWRRLGASPRPPPPFCCSFSRRLSSARGPTLQTTDRSVSRPKTLLSTKRCAT